MTRMKEFFNKCLFASFVMMVGFNVSFAATNECQSNSVLTDGTCQCKSGYSPMNYGISADTKVSSYTVDSGVPYKITATTLLNDEITILATGISTNSGNYPIETTPAGADGSKCWCRISYPFETGWKYSGSSVSGTPGTDEYLTACVKKCGDKLKSNNIASWFNGYMLNDGTICEVSAITTYTITYDLNGGYGCSNTTYSGTTTLCNPERTGYSFNGWTDSNTSSTYSGGTSVTNTNLNLTASWTYVGCNNGYYFANDTCNACDSGYTSNGSTATSTANCYRDCVTTDIQHSTDITGQVFQDGTNTCQPTSCDSGYSPQAATPDLMTLIGASEAGEGYVATDNSGFQSSNYNGMTASGAGISGEASAFVVDYGNKGIVRGHAQCSTQSGSRGTMMLNTYPDITTYETLPDNTGLHCYCHLDSYIANGTQTSIVLSAPWVYNTVYGTSYADYCTDGGCAYACAYHLRTGESDDLAFRAAVFGTVNAGPAMCELENYTITYDLGGGDVVDNPTTYTITTSTFTLNNPIKYQYRFDGWCLDDPTCSNPQTTYTIYTGTTGDKTLYAKFTYVDCDIGNYYDTATNSCVSRCNSALYEYWDNDAGECKHDYDSECQDTFGPEFLWDSDTSKCKMLICPVGYTDNDIITTIFGVDASSKGNGYTSKSNNGQYCYGSQTDSCTNNTLNNGEWETSFSYGTVKGIASCNTTPESGNANTNYMGTNTSGQYCWCQMTHFIPTDGVKQTALSDWVFRYDRGDNSSCQNHCAGNCASYLKDKSSFRNALFGTAGKECSIIVHNITYYLDDGVAENPIEYTIDTPTFVVNNPTKENDEFIGWCENDVNCSTPILEYTIYNGETTDKVLYARYLYSYHGCESGVKMHVGEDAEACLLSTKRSSPSLVIETNNGTYYLSLSENPDLTINHDTTKKMRVYYRGTTYNVSDASVRY